MMLPSVNAAKAVLVTRSCGIGLARVHMSSSSFRCQLAFLALVGCGARSEIADEPLPDASVVDVSLDVADALEPMEASVDVSAGASDGSQICCDDGFKKSGCQTCAASETCLSKAGTCITEVTECGPTTCMGCCITSTECSDGKEVGACGMQGQVCQTCTVDNSANYSSCIAQAGGGGVCAGGQTCGENCDGCCNGVVCTFGTSDTSCGFRTPCMACAPGESCVENTPTGGVCTAEHN
jgi:hypothetical protein